MTAEVKKTVIVTDSVADLPDNIIEKYNIKVVPLYINFGGRSYRENLELSPDTVYSELISGRSIKTSTPSVEDFINIYTNIKKNDNPETVYSIHMSSALSGTFNSAVSARSLMVNMDMDIRIIDSKKAAICEGFIVLSAARAAMSGAPTEKIDRLIGNLIDSSYFYATFEDFKYVLKGGRAPFLAGFIEKAMPLKPVITFNPAGRLKLKKFCLNKESSIRELYSFARSDIIRNDMGRCMIGICYGNDIGPALELKELVTDDPQIHTSEILMTQMTTVMAVHTGPGIWGIAVCPYYENR
jgi:DegV family protein with EDD domain